MIPAEFKLREVQFVLWDNFYWILVAVALYVIALAFKRGYQLQQEQDLTV
jgi:hypothetical protein